LIGKRKTGDKKMIILKPDGTMAVTYSDYLPSDCVQVNADGTLYTPPVTPAPVTPAAPPSLTEQQAQGWEAAGAAARLRAHAAAVEKARLDSLAAFEADKTAAEDLGGETYRLKNDLPDKR
jgi:hypothetical protein